MNETVDNEPVVIDGDGVVEVEHLVEPATGHKDGLAGCLHAPNA